LKCLDIYIYNYFNMLWPIKPLILQNNKLSNLG